MTSPLDRAVAAATAYVTWCRSDPRPAAAEARLVLGLLCDLVRAAVDLQERADAPEFDLPRLSDEEWGATYRRAAALPFQHYAHHFSPAADEVEGEESTTGDLSDDLADIHRDLAEGLAILEVGAGRAESRAAAEWTLAFSFRMHWGRHATAAIDALACWLSDETAWDDDRASA